MRNTLNLVWKLLLICLIAGLVLGLVNQVTKDRIAKLDVEAANEARSAAFPGAAKFEPLRKDTDKVHDFYSALDDKGEVIGYVASSREHGYGGDVEVVIGMDTAGKIVGCVIGQNGDFSETAGLGAKVKDPAFAEQFLGIVYSGNEIAYNAGGGGYRIPAGSLRVERIESTGTDPDAVSGATYSSTAVIHAVNNIVSELGSLLSGGEK
ncbi:MAG: FMN-binding protein [Clostridia bacterium]|nr:FMN-binding protein [Clostridia bacterium]